MTKIIGVIAEDMSDVEVIKILLKKLTNKRFSTAQFVGKGCGPLKKKIPGWCKAFHQKGVVAVLVIHDLDKNSAHLLRDKLESMLPSNVFINTTVVIPVEELESWLLSDEKAIQVAMKLHTTPKAIHHPETIVSPKEHLGELVRKHSKNGLKQYVNTVHNSLIANELIVGKLSKCASFETFKTFVSTAIG
jgi:Domain of unknown function (DUF4276)